jgi:hypothetical protein
LRSSIRCRICACTVTSSGGRLVGDQDVRPVGERHRDHHPLALAAGELVRILPEPRLRVRNLHLGQQLEPALRRLAAHELLVQHQAFAELGADGVDRVEARHRLLEDHRDAVAAELAHPAVGEVRHVLAGVGDPRRVRDPGALGQEPHHRPRRHRLARARLADQRDRLALAQLEGDVAHRFDQAAVYREGDADLPRVDHHVAEGFRYHVHGGPPQ